MWPRHFAGARDRSWELTQGENALISADRGFSASGDGIENGKLRVIKTIGWRAIVAKAPWIRNSNPA